MPKAKYDLNDNGKIDPEERGIMIDDRRGKCSMQMPRGIHNVEWQVCYEVYFVSVWRSV